MKKLFVHTTAAALLLSQLGMANSAFAAENETTSSTTPIQNEEAPALVKGDFFYFVKTTVEKIQLLLTTDKVKEAELLAEFAGERIHEARELIKEGKEDLAKETLKEALTQMEVAQGQVDVKLPTVTDLTEGTATTEGTTTTEGTVTTEGTTTTEDTTTPSDETDKEETEKEEIEKEETQKLTKEQKEIAKIQHHLNTNLLVLANVLDQVKNPKAKAAIAKNIEKSFNRISEKLEKVLKQTEKNETILNPVITIKYPENNTTDVGTENTATPEVITTITKVEDVEEVDHTDVAVVENDDDFVASTEKVTKPKNPNHKNGYYRVSAHKEDEKETEKEAETKTVKVKKVEKVEKEVKHENAKSHKQNVKNENHGKQEKQQKNSKEHASNNEKGNKKEK